MFSNCFFVPIPFVRTEKYFDWTKNVPNYNHETRRPKCNQNANSTNVIWKYFGKHANLRRTTEQEIFRFPINFWSNYVLWIHSEFFCIHMSFPIESTNRPASGDQKSLKRLALGNWQAFGRYFPFNPIQFQLLPLKIRFTWRRNKNISRINYHFDG